MAKAIDILGETLAGRVNVGGPERLVSGVAGAALLAGAIRRGGGGGAVLAAVGTALLHRAVTGHCNLYGAFGVDTTREGRAHRGEMPAHGPPEGVVLEASVTVNRSAAELFDYWRDFSHAPEFMQYVRRVEPLDGDRSRWIAETPGGRTMEWTSEISEEVPGRRIAWRSLPGSELANRGSVEFLPGLRPGETVVRQRVEIDPPGGVVGEALLGIFGRIPESMVRDDLARFRTLMETGVVAAPTSETEAG